ncbi:hypothetical protein Dtox_1808 [Desulfofarcimen acetoxidans DSM 771]|uniref:ABC transporter permease n=1 Tax=Desulfofarcimen acetoxidans (strain ATCC 49208 / DSM 771 / KCTC 5769 / VKM B-1644 / 5575) TaxID=485916 RepID=C8VXK5_DESAS|nr:ABC transporter permease subunit [Desulfofarcimen acetoxidans]ACV62661.1 hypothetical protein Dtox_1808 [Desulfofarcimen acetoxidans DSM 771]
MITIAAITFREVLRKKVLLTTLLLAVAFFALYGTGLYHVNKDYHSAPTMLKNVLMPQLYLVGLYFGNFIIAFLAIFSSVGTISTEVENGTMHAILSRPISRSHIVLGKFGGYAGMLTVGAAVFFAAVTLLINIITGFHLPNAALLVALALFCFQPLLLLALAVMGTTFLPTLSNGVALFSLYAVGTIGGIIEQIGNMARSETLTNIGIVSSLLIPTDAMYRKLTCVIAQAANSPLISTQMGPFGSQSEPSHWMIVYSICYFMSVLLIAVLVFSRRDV